MSSEGWDVKVVVVIFTVLIAADRDFCAVNRDDYAVDVRLGES
jgi:hypothetical protein